MGNAYAKEQSAYPLESPVPGEHTRRSSQSLGTRLKRFLRSDALAGYLFIAPAIVGFLILWAIR